MGAGSAGLAARGVALDVVDRCLGGEYLAPALRQALDASGLTGADRSLVADLGYGTVRRLLQLDAALAPYLKSPERLPKRVLHALRIAAYELLYRGTASYAAVSAWVELVKREASGLAPLANAVLRKVARIGPPPAAGTVYVESDPERDPEPEPATDPERDLALPPWLWREFVTSMGEGAARRAALGMLEPEPLWLTSFADRAEAVLVEQGCEVGEGPPLVGSAKDDHDENGHAVEVRSLRVRSPVPLDRLDAYRQGLVQPQNPSSLYAALLLGSAELVFDLAAGQGVKTAVLVATGYASSRTSEPVTERPSGTASGHSGGQPGAGSRRILAVERSAKRTRAAQANLRRLAQGSLPVQQAKRAEVESSQVEPPQVEKAVVERSEVERVLVEHVVADLVTIPAGELSARAGGQAGRVLLDAPCSGTGTLRGHPEIKLRLTAADLAALATTQAAMLDTAAALVAPGGRLLYAVCSLTSAEGPHQVASFLARNDDFRSLAFTPPLPHQAAGPGTFVLPVDGLDGFFLALLERGQEAGSAALLG